MEWTGPSRKHAVSVEAYQNAKLLPPDKRSEYLVNFFNRYGVKPPQKHVDVVNQRRALLENFAPRPAPLSSSGISGATVIGLLGVVAVAGVSAWFASRKN